MDSTKKQLSVKFHKFEVHSNGHVEYTIAVTNPVTKDFWQFRTRYKELENLNKKLREIKGLNIPEFPPKKWFGNKDKAFLTQRMKKLETYFYGVFQNPGVYELPFVMSFFENRSKTSNSASMVGAQQQKANSPQTGANASTLTGSKRVGTVLGGVDQQRQAELENGLNKVVRNFIDIPKHYIFQAIDEDGNKTKKEGVDQFPLKMQCKITRDMNFPHDFVAAKAGPEELEPLPYDDERVFQEMEKFLTAYWSSRERGVINDYMEKNKLIVDIKHEK
jgi:PX domain